MAGSSGTAFVPSTAWREVALPDEQGIFERFAHDIEGFQREDAKRAKDGKLQVLQREVSEFVAGLRAA